MRIGAALPLTEIALRWTGAPPAFRDWLLLFASPPIRNRATLGGKSGDGFAHRRFGSVVAGAGCGGPHRWGARKAHGSVGVVLHGLPADGARTRRVADGDRNSQAVRVVDSLLQSGETARGRHQYRGRGVLDGSGCRGAGDARRVCVRRRRGGSAARVCGGRGGARGSAGIRPRSSACRRCWSGRSSRSAIIAGPPNIASKWRRVWSRNSGGNGRRRPHEDRRQAGSARKRACARIRCGALHRRFVPALSADILHAWPVLAPHAHALLLRLDASPALEEPGVCTVLTGADVPGEGDSGSVRATTSRCFRAR